MSEHENIPDELKARDQWLLWDSDNHKPRQPHWRGDFGISWSNPDDWHTFEEACDAATERDTWGIGYVTAVDNPDYARGLYGVVDLDGCADSNGAPKDWVPGIKPFVERDAYIEWSPSGTGLHIPVWNIDTPDWWSDVQIDEHEGVDVLTNKFCTFTGDCETASGEDAVDMGDWLVEWLADAYENIKGETAPPRQNKTFGDYSNNDRDDDEEYDGDDLTESQVKEALDHVDSSLHYNDWLRVGFAVYDWDSGARGRRLFESWSRSNGKWDAEKGQSHIDDIWANDSANGSVGVGTLVHHAQQGGWSFGGGSSGGSSGEIAGDGGVSAASPQGSDGPNTDAENGSAGWVAETKPYAAAVNDDKSPITLKDARSKASEKAMEDYDFITPQAEGEALNKYPLWIYESIDGCYEKRGGAQIAEDLSGGISSFSTSDQNEVANLTKRKTLTSRDRLDAEHEDHLLINVENGVFDVDADEKLPHSAAFNFRHVHPFDYDPDASAEPVLDFMDEVVAEDYEKQTLLEYIGYCFEDGYPLPQFLLLYGTGGNGKGIFFEIVEALLGKPNTSSVALEHMLGDNDYMMAELDGSFVNIDGDIPGSVINTQELNAIKKLTGRDSITVQRKFEHPFELENRAKLMFAANKPPRFHDNTNSVARRLMAIEFPYEFVEDPGPGQKQRRPYRELMAELTADETLSGLFNEAITAYQQVRERGHFTIEEQGSNQERLDEYRRNADPIVAFADRCLENQENMAVPKEILYTIYTRFAEDHGQYPAKKNVLLRKLGRSTDIDVVTGRPTLNVEGGKRRIRICDHLWFKAEALEYLSHELREDVLMATAKLHSTTAPYAEDFLGLSPDADRETGGIVADTKRICRVLNEEGPIHRDELVDAIRERHDMTADRMTEALQRALEQGDAIALQSDHFDAA